MQQRRVGNTEVAVGAMGLGCNALSGTYRSTDDDRGIALVHRAIELGVGHFDTSDTYGGGHNEQLLGRAFAGRRDEVFLASKFGQLTENGKRTVRGDAEYVHRACDASLERLGVEHIDLYYAHRIDPTVPLEETIGAMAELVEAGKVRYLGVSEAAPGTVRRAHAIHPLTAVQIEYSLWTRFAEAEHFGVCRELGISFVPYAPMGRGFLSGEIKSLEDLEAHDRRRQHPRFAQENIDQNVIMLQALQDVALAHGVSPSQVALAWVLAQGDFMLPIPGTTSTVHLEENVAATEIQLTAEDLAALDSAFAPERVAGPRYPDSSMARVQL